MSYGKALFVSLKPLPFKKTIEDASEYVMNTEGIRRLTLNINGKKVLNMTTDVEYVPDFQYNLVAIGVLEISRRGR